MPLQECELVVDGGFRKLESLEDGVVGVAERGRAVAALAAEVDLVVLDASQLLECTFGRQLGAGVLEAHAHDAVQHQSDEADQRMGTDAVGQAVEHRGDLDLGFENLEAALDVGQALVASQNLKRRQLWHIGHQQQLAVAQFCTRQRLVVDDVGEQIRLQVDLDDRAQMRLGDRAIQPGLSTGVAQAPASEGGAAFLRIKLASTLLGFLREFSDMLAARCGLFQGAARIVGPDQAQVLPAGLAEDLAGGRRAAQRVNRLQDLGELGVAPPRHGQDELHGLLGAAHALPAQPLQIVQAEQTAIGHQHHALDRVQRQNLLNHGAERRCLGRVPFPDPMRQRQSLGRLHHAEHELATHPPVLGQAELAQVAGQLGLALHADGGHVVEHHRQILVDQRAQQPGQRRLDAVLVFDQRIHRPQQVLMRHLLGRKARQRHRLQPAQHAELGRRVAQAVEHHQAHQRLDVDAAARATKNPAQLAKSQFVPQLGQRPYVAQGAAGLEPHVGHGRHRAGLRRRVAAKSLQAADHALKLAASLVGAPQGGHRAFLHPPALIPVGLHELDVAATAGGGDLDEHAATIHQPIFKWQQPHNVEKRATTRTFPKTRLTLCSVKAGSAFSANF